MPDPRLIDNSCSKVGDYPFLLLTYSAIVASLPSWNNADLNFMRGYQRQSLLVSSMAPISRFVIRVASLSFMYFSVTS